MSRLATPAAVQRRRHGVAACLLVLALLAGPVVAQQTPEMTAAYQADTGERAVDAVLADINRYVERHPDAFVDELQRYAAVSRSVSEAWLDSGSWQAGDVYFACQLAQISERPCQHLLDARLQAGQGGWKAALASLEPALKPAHWQQLRQRIVASYRHWARPLPEGARGLR